MRAVCIQMCSGDEVTANLAAAERLLEAAAGRGASLVVLPENFALMSNVPEAKRRVAEELSRTTILPFLSAAARRYAFYLVGGSVPYTGTDGRRWNRCPVYGPDGSCCGTYDKLHLFDVDLPGESHRESAVFAPGETPVSVDLGGWRLGLSICYDLRFPELYRRYAREGCLIMSVPSAFTVPTGRAHWEILLRARAIENQAYVLAAAQTGSHAGTRRTWGHSMIVDPWGEIVAGAAHNERDEGGEELVSADLDRQLIERIRRQLPALAHRRADW